MVDFVKDNKLISRGLPIVGTIVGQPAIGTVAGLIANQMGWGEQQGGFWGLTSAYNALRRGVANTVSNRIDDALEGKEGVLSQGARFARRHQLISRGLNFAGYTNAGNVASQFGFGQQGGQGPMINHPPTTQSFDEWVRPHTDNVIQPWVPKPPLIII